MEKLSPFRVVDACIKKIMNTTGFKYEISAKERIINFWRNYINLKKFDFLQWRISNIVENVTNEPAG